MGDVMIFQHELLIKHFFEFGFSFEPLIKKKENILIQ